MVKNIPVRFYKWIKIKLLITIDLSCIWKTERESTTINRKYSSQIKKGFFRSNIIIEKMGLSLADH